MRGRFAILIPVVLAAVAHAKAPLVERVMPMESEKRPTPVAYPVRTDTPPEIDGKLDDACWKSAARLGPMRISETGQAVAEDSTGYVCFDDGALYVGVEAVEGQIDNLLGKEQGGREDRWDGDEIEFFIAPHGDGVRYYQFTVGA